MADQILTSRLESLVETASKKVDLLEREVNLANQNIKKVDNKIDNISNELSELKKDFIKLVQDERKRHILQKAGTELIRVRQEIDDKFGKYKEVRETMLGVLQATDVALVKQNTISKVSEEIMLATPKYWLSPCLVAISAWIANDRTLAERAIKVAMDRSKEKTSLVMALICRRNERVDTCYEWLNIYFSTQNAKSFTEGTYAVVSAYLNGIFGDDKRHLCNGYVEKWLKDILSDEAEVNQENQWMHYYEDNYLHNINLNYPELSKVEEFNHISSYLKRIVSLSNIKNNFNSIVNSDVYLDELKDKVDKELFDLVNRYDDDELSLRNEEMEYQAIKEFDGNEEMAREKIQRIKLQRQEATKDFLAQLSSAFNKSSSPVNNADKKTALKFVGKYAQRGLNKYIEKGKETFPKQITITENDWESKLGHNTTLDEAVSSYTEYMRNKASEEINSIRISQEKEAKTKLITSIIVGVISIPLLLIYIGFFTLALAGFLYWKSNKIKNNIDNICNEKIKTYEDMTKIGIENINKIHNEWSSCLNSINNFEKNKNLAILNNFEVA